MKMPVLRTFVVAAGIAAVSSSAFAQNALTKEQVDRRFQIRMFGQILVGAAQQGAALMGMRVQQIDPSVILLSGTAPRAQGFLIEGHGVFFHIEVPNVDPVVAWAVTNRGRDQATIEMISDLERLLDKETNPQERTRIEQSLRRAKQRLLPPGSQQSQAGGAMTVSGMAPSAPAPAPPIMTNPSLEYERLVMEQLINAMLDHSHQLGLAADEWLTVAARGSEGPLVPNMVFDDTVTIMLRIKGSDLADFRAGRLARDEARARVVVREF